MITHLRTVQQSLGRLDPLEMNQQVSINITCFFMCKVLLSMYLRPCFFLVSTVQLTICCLLIQ